MMSTSETYCERSHKVHSLDYIHLASRALKGFLLKHSLEVEFKKDSSSLTHTSHLQKRFQVQKALWHLTKNSSWRFFKTVSHQIGASLDLDCADFSVVLHISKATLCRMSKAGVISEDCNR